MAVILGHYYVEFFENYPFCHEELDSKCHLCVLEFFCTQLIKVTETPSILETLATMLSPKNNQIEKLPAFAPCFPTELIELLAKHLILQWYYQDSKITSAQISRH
jgi:hypothetical protein